MANVGDIAAKVAVQTGETVPARFVRQVLEHEYVPRWLDTPGGWFWIPGVPQNRLLSTVRKILAVAGSTEIGELRRGIARHHRMQGFAPPPDVLLELCRQQAEYEVRGYCNELSRAAITGGIVSFPAALASRLDAEYRLESERDDTRRTVFVRRGLAWRLAPMFRLEGCRAGIGSGWSSTLRRARRVLPGSGDEAPTPTEDHRLLTGVNCRNPDLAEIDLEASRDCSVRSLLGFGSGRRCRDAPE